VKIFAQTVAVHEQMGGRLGKTLQRLSSVIRERGEYIEKLRSATSLGRFAAIMITLIGLGALLYLVLFQPEYLGRLTQSPLGQRMIIYAAVSEVVGVVLIFLTLNAEL
jgi:tight adherence protein B